MDDLRELTPKQKDVIRQYITKIRQELDDPLIGPKEMGELMGFSKPRAYAIMTDLEEEDLLYKVPRKGFKLTDAGREIINELIHRTKIMETYFHKELGMELDSAERDAQNIVLNVSIDFISSLCDILGQPTSCPHNYFIPHHKKMDHSSEKSL